MKHRSVFFALMALILAAGLYAGVVPPGKDSVTQPQRGASSEPEDVLFAHSRIISLAPSITEILFALGVDERIVGITRYCDYPKETAGIETVGGYFDINYEAILAKEPDLVILLAEHDDPEAYIKGLGIQVLSVDHSSVGGIVNSIRTLGKLLEVEAAGTRLANKLENKLQKISGATKGRRRPRVMVAVGRGMERGSIGEVYISGRDGFYDELITLAGGENAYQDETLKFPALSIEGVVRLNPEFIFEMLPDVKEIERVDQITGKWHAIPSVDAIENGRIHIFVEDFVVVPGPRFILLLEKMARVLHPGIDWESL